MKRELVLACLAVAGLTVGGAGVAAAAGSAPTTLTLVDFADSNGNASSDYIIGTVDSPKRKCISGRSVSLVRLSNGHVMDRTRTSRNGYFAVGGVEEINSIEGEVRVARKVLGHGDNRFVCKATAEDFD